MITFTYTTKVTVFVGPALTSLAYEALGYQCKGDHIQNLLPHSLSASSDCPPITNLREDLNEYWWT